MSVKVAEDLTALVIHAEKPRGSVPAARFEQPQQITHEPRSGGYRTAHSVPDTNDGIDEPPGQE